MYRHLSPFLAAALMVSACAASDPQPGGGTSNAPAVADAPLSNSSANRSSTGDGLRYPVILPDAASQQAIGVVEHNYGAGGPALGNWCYYYGDGGGDLSLSDEFVAGYRDQGFSLRTICMAMASGIRFNPETGKRLATVQAVDIPAATAPDYFGEPGPIGPETPVELPACFARGLPLSDCTFAFDPRTGAKLSPAQTARLASAGRTVLDTGAALLASGAYGSPCAGGEHLTAYYNDSAGDLQERTPAELESCYVETASGAYTAGRFVREYHINRFHSEMLPLGGFVDVSPAFDTGFAYAIYADGAAGPSFELDDKALVADGKSRSSQAVLESLKLIARGG